VTTDDDTACICLDTPGDMWGCAEHPPGTQGADMTWTYTDRLGGETDTNYVLDELRKDMELAGLTQADMDTVEWALREVLDAERH
jgi:hypothetical protein